MDLKTANYHPLLQHKLILKKFWLEYGDSRQGRRGVSKRSTQKTLNELVRLGGIVIHYHKGLTPLAMRKMFDKNKNRRYRFQNFKLCFACGAKAKARHHIIWLKNGGRNSKINIIGLCFDCHAYIHPWLRVQYPYG